MDVTYLTSGVAGGYEGSQQGAQQQAAPTGEKQDWLDKGITAAGKKFGFNVVCFTQRLRTTST